LIMPGSLLITGASTGIGRACAYYLDEMGYQVFAGVRQLSDGEALKSQASDRLTPVLLDVTDEGTIARALRQVQDGVGSGLVGLVNNAGIAAAAPLEFIPLDVLRRQMEVNVIGQVAVTQAFLPLLRQSVGRVVFISSISGRVASPLLGPYAASKFALEALADTLRRELYPWGLKVSVVEPGRVDTPIWEKSVAAADGLVERLPAEAHALYGAMFARNRLSALRPYRGAPVEAVARAVAHALTSRRPKTRYLVGRDARLVAPFLRLLPDWLLDRLMVSQRGFETKSLDI